MKNKPVLLAIVFLLFCGIAYFIGKQYPKAVLPYIILAPLIIGIAYRMWFVKQH